MTALASNSNLLDLYLYHVGESEVPKGFHKWACISLVAACVQKRVYYQKFAWKRLYPNLYTILVGPSGLGKDIAIELAISFVASVPTITCYKGTASAPFLTSYMSKPIHQPNGDKVFPNVCMWLVTSELASSVKRGPMADLFIKFMTDIYSGSDACWKEGTRTQGNLEIPGPNMNWLAGSTKEWLVEAVSTEAIKSGFFGRLCLYEEDYNFNLKHYKPTFPTNYELVRQLIQQRIDELATLTGEFRMTAEAEHIDQQWYEERPAPVDQSLYPNWKRAHDLVQKLMMVASLCESTNLVIEKRHVIWAQREENQMQQRLPKFVDWALQTPLTKPHFIIKNVLAQYPLGLTRKELVIRCFKHGITSREVSDALYNMVDAGEIEHVYGPDFDYYKHYQIALPEETVDG